MVDAGVLDTIRWIDALGADGPLLAVLMAGHATADFCFQSQAMVDAKHASTMEPRLRALALHGLTVAVLHTLWLAGFGLGLAWGPAAALGAAIAVTHVLIDATKPALVAWLGDLRAFALDQFAHIAVLIGVFCVVRTTLTPIPPALGEFAVIATAFAFVIHGAASVVQSILAQYAPASEAAILSSETPHAAVNAAMTDSVRRGRLVGILERIIVLALVLVNQWAAIGLIITAKSVARFKRIEVDQAFGETYLIGTLTSVLLAAGAGAAVRLVL